MSTWEMMENVKDQVITYCDGPLADIIGIVACMLAGWNVIVDMRDIIRGSDLDLIDIGKNILIVVLVCNFNTMVLRPFDSFVNATSREIVEMFAIENDEYISEWRGNMEKISSKLGIAHMKEYEQELEELSQEPMITRAFGTAWIAVKKMLKQVFGVKSMTFAGIVGGILFVMAKIVIMAQQIICSLLLILCGIICPFSMTLSITRTFSNSWKIWLARYIQISSWIPVGYFCLWLVLIFTKVMSSNISSTGMTLGAEWLMIIVEFICLILVTAVPKISGLVIESTGANDVHGAVTGPIRTIGRAVTRI